MEETLAERGIAPGIAAAIEYSRDQRDPKAYALRRLFQVFDGYRFPPAEGCGGCEPGSGCLECADLRTFYANGDWRAQEPWYWANGLCLMEGCAPGIAAASACYEVMGLQKDWHMPEPHHVEVFGAEQLMAIALCELAAMNDACAPRPWTAAFLRLAGPIPEIEGTFAQLCEMDARDVLRSCLAGTATLLDGARG